MTLMQLKLGFLITDLSQCLRICMVAFALNFFIHERKVT